jgi:hypothetical protein
MISPDREQEMRAALAELEADAERAEQAAPGLVQGWWESLTGGSAEPERNLAAAARRDAERFRLRLVDLLSSATATDEDAARFIAEAGASLGQGAAPIVEAGTAAGSIGEAVRQTVGGTLDDLGLPPPRDWLKWAKRGVFVLGGALAFLVIRDARRGLR